MSLASLARRDSVIIIAAAGSWNIAGGGSWSSCNWDDVGSSALSSGGPRPSGRRTQAASAGHVAFAKETAVNAIDVLADNYGLHGLFYYLDVRLIAREDHAWNIQPDARKAQLANSSRELADSRRLEHVQEFEVDDLWPTAWKNWLDLLANPHTRLHVSDEAPYLHESDVPD